MIAASHAAGVRASVTLGASFGCPFEGPVPEARVLEHVERMAAAGADEIMLADTIGVGVPSQVRSLVPGALRAAGGIPIGLHLHNTRNTGYANADAGIESGATLFDASIGGLGGCPFAPRATGNIATEDLVYLLDGLGVETGVDLDALIAVAEWLAGVLGRELPGSSTRPARSFRRGDSVVAFIGLGRMGRLMAPHLVAAGHEVRGYDLDPAAGSPGSSRPRARAEAARGAEIAITMLPSPAAVRAATLGPGGLGEGLARGALCIDMSTAPPGLARELAAALAPLGIEALDAPVSGGTIGAEAGTLTIMVGGAEAAVDRARPVLETMGKLVVHVGDHGLGQAAKLCNNLCAGINMAAIAQAVALARREGLDPAVLYELMSNSTGDSRVLRTRFPAPVSQTTPAAHGFAPMFTVDLMEKDLTLAEQLTAEHGLEAEPLAAALALYRRAQGEGHGSLDYSAIALTTGGAEPRPIDQLIEELRSELGVQRATVRVDVPDAVFPVRYEVLADGAGSIRDDPTDMTRQPVPRVLAEHGGQVVQEDAAAAFPGDAGFHAMRERFGGMRAQIVTGCYRDGALVALLSVHDLQTPRPFSAADRERCRAAAATIAGMLDDPA